MCALPLFCCVHLLGAVRTTYIQYDSTSAALRSNGGGNAVCLSSVGKMVAGSVHSAHRRIRRQRGAAQRIIVVQLPRQRLWLRDSRSSVTVILDQSISSCLELNKRLSVVSYIDLRKYNKETLDQLHRLSSSHLVSACRRVLESFNWIWQNEEIIDSPAAPTHSAHITSNNDGSLGRTQDQS